MELRELGPSDVAALRSFTCFDPRVPPSIVVDESVRRGLVDEICASDLTRRVTALGLWDEVTLAAVIAWRVQLIPQIPPATGNWLVALLAVENRYKGRRLGQQLKLALFERAQQEGIERIVSEVDHDNAPMIRLNARLAIPYVQHPNYDDMRLYSWRVDAR